jgi:hypothetical protein
MPLTSRQPKEGARDLDNPDAEYALFAVFMAGRVADGRLGSERCE